MYWLEMERDDSRFAAKTFAYTKAENSKLTVNIENDIFKIVLLINFVGQNPSIKKGIAFPPFEGIISLSH